MEVVVGEKHYTYAWKCVWGAAGTWCQTTLGRHLEKWGASSRRSLPFSAIFPAHTKRFWKYCEIGRLSKVTVLKWYETREKWLTWTDSREYWDFGPGLRSHREERLNNLWMSRYLPVVAQWPREDKYHTTGLVEALSFTCLLSGYWVKANAFSVAPMWGSPEILASVNISLVQYSSHVQ